MALLAYTASAIAMLGTAAMSPVLPAMIAGLGVTETEVSLMMTVFTLPVVVFVPVLGWTADRVGRRPVLGASLLVFGAAGTAIYFADSFAVVLALRVLQGVGFSGIIPLVVVIVGDLFSGADEVGAQGMRVAFVNAGAFLFPVATGLLAEIAWNVPFLLFAVAVPAGAVVLRWMPEPSARRPPPAGYLRAVLAAAGDRRVAVALVAGPLRFFLLYGLYTFLPVLVVAHGVSVAAAGTVVGAVNAAKLVVASQSRRSLGFGTPQRTMAVGLLPVTAAMALFAVAETFVGFLLVALAFGAADGVVAPLQKSVLTQNTAAEVRAGMIATNAVFQNAAKTVAPVSLGLLIAVTGVGGVFVAVAVAGGLVALGLVVALAAGTGVRPGGS